MILLLVVFGVIALAVSAVIMQTQSLSNYARRLSYPVSLQEVRDNVEAALDNDGAWYQTIANNTSLSCLQTNGSTCTSFNTPITIQVFEADGSNFIGGSPTQGFQADGSICNTFGVGPDASCLYQYQVTLQCNLVGGVCPTTTFKASSTSIVAAQPAVTITATLVLSPLLNSNEYSDVIKTNLSPYTVNVTRGQMASTLSNFCNSMPGGTYSQKDQKCQVSYLNSSFDCRNPLRPEYAGPYSWFIGFDNLGNPKCRADQKIAEDCADTTGVLGIDSNGNFICGMF